MGESMYYNVLYSTHSLFFTKDDSSIDFCKDPCVRFCLPNKPYKLAITQYVWPGF